MTCTRLQNFVNAAALLFTVTNIVHVHPATTWCWYCSWPSSLQLTYVLCHICCLWQRWIPCPSLLGSNPPFWTFSARSLQEQIANNPGSLPCNSMTDLEIQKLEDVLNCGSAWEHISKAGTGLKYKTATDSPWQSLNLQSAQLIKISTKANCQGWSTVHCRAQN